MLLEQLHELAEQRRVVPDGYFPAISVHGRFLGRHGGTAKQEMLGLLGSGGFQASGEIERTGASRRDVS